MKHLNKFKIIFVLLLIIISTNANAQIIKAEIRAAGLTCSMCSNAINKQLKTLSEVINVETDLNTNTFIVSLKEQNELSPKVFKEKVEKAGFFVGSLIITAKSTTIAQSSYIKINDKNSKGSEVNFQVIDKGYVTDKEYKKLSKSYKNSATYTLNNEDDFHIKIID